MVITAHEMELKPGYQQTEVGVMPDDWKIVLLDSVAKRGSGHTPDKKHPEYWNGDIKWISLKDSDRLDSLYIKDTAAKVTPAGIANSSAVIHPAGTVVLSRDAGVGKSAITTDMMAVSQHFMAWQCGPSLDNHFLYYWLRARKPEFERIAMGNTIKTIGLPYFKQLKIPCPPLPEQTAIANALSDVDALITSLDKLIAKKCDIKQATMQQLLTGKTRLSEFCKGAKLAYKQTEVGMIPDDWKVEKLGNCLLGAPQYGINAPAIQYTDSLPKYIRITDITDDGYFSSEKMASVNHISADKYMLEAGDLVFARTGASVGKTYLYNTKEGILVFAGFLIRVKANPSKLLPAYLAACVKTERYWSWVRVMSMRSGQPGINGNEYTQLPIPLPSLSEQKAIATVLSDMDAEIAALEQKRDKTRALKQGMMQELLTGKTRLV